MSKVYDEIDNYEEPDIEYIITTDVLMEALYGRNYLKYILRVIII